MEKYEKYDFGQLRDFLMQITKALDHLSKKKIIHRDMKLENVLITEKSNPVAMLTDFGLANPKVKGLTPGQCAPEQMKTGGSKLAKTDLFALGISIVFTLFDEQIGIALLFLPTKKIPTEIVDTVRENRAVKLVRKMVLYEANERIDFHEVLSVLEYLDESSETINILSKTDFKKYDIISKRSVKLVTISTINKVTNPSRSSVVLSNEFRDQLDRRRFL